MDLVKRLRISEAIGAGPLEAVNAFLERIAAANHWYIDARELTPLASFQLSCEVCTQSNVNNGE